MLQPINRLKNKYTGPCYIVGKGASLDFIKVEDFPISDAPILCLNQTVTLIEQLDLPNPIYSVQQDGWLDRKWVVFPQKATVITSTHNSKIFPTGYVYDQVRDLRIIDKIITAVSAVSIAKLMGCTKIIFVAFDIATENSDKHPSFFIEKYGVYPAEEKYKSFYDIIRLHLGKFQIPASFYSIITKKTIDYKVADYSIITTTRDRPMAFDLCRQFVVNQTVLPRQWLIVDDGRNPLRWKSIVGGEYIRREPKKDDPAHTAKINLLTGFRYLVGEKIFIFEDDDYYRNDYVETYLPYLDNHDLVGKDIITVYNLEHNMHKTYTNLSYSTFAATCFNKRILNHVTDACSDFKFATADTFLWAKDLNKKLVPTETFVSIKGVGGQPGTTRAHRLNELIKDEFAKDKDRSHLKKLLGADYKYYEDIHPVIPTVVYVPQQPEYIKTNSEIAETRGISNYYSMDNFPNILRNSALRLMSDGKLHLVRKDAKLEKFMDAFFIKDGANCWLNGSKNMSDLNELRPLFNEVVYIIGKGPSLDKLDVEHFDKGPIICINESVHKIDSLDLTNFIISCQQDSGIKNTCLGKSGSILVSADAQYWYPEVLKKYVFTKSMLKLTGNVPTAVAAITISRMLGAQEIILYAFDSMKGDLNYANCIGYKSNKKGDPKRFLGHHSKIYKSLEGIKYQLR